MSDMAVLVFVLLIGLPIFLVLATCLLCLVFGG